MTHENHSAGDIDHDLKEGDVVVEWNADCRVPMTNAEITKMMSNGESMKTRCNVQFVHRSIV